MRGAPPVRWGFSPLDEALALGREHFAPQLRAGLVQLGTWMPFHQVPAAAWALFRVTVSAETVRRLTEQAGATLEAADAATLALLEAGEPVPAEAGPAVQQLSVDGAMVPLVGGQWGEVKTLVTGAVEQRPDKDGHLQPHTGALSYFSRLADAETFGRQATVETHRRGTDTAGVVCGPADGAVWVQRFLDLVRPDAVRILDFPHAVEHLGAVASTVFGAGTVAGCAWLRTVRRELRDGEPAAAVAALCMVPVEEAADAVTALAARDGAITYVTSRWEQIQYATFRQAGYPIGSGAVESANKLVVEVRLKGSGMHWAPANVNAMLALRTAWCSGRWAARWQEGQSQRQQRRAAERGARAAAIAARTICPVLPATDPTPVVPVATAQGRESATVPPVGLRQPQATHPWRHYGRRLTPRPGAKL
jgi:hypothetical protein